MNLEQKINDYEATEQIRQLVASTKIVLIVGISGAGKDTVKQQLLQDDTFSDIVSYTTRAPRQNGGEWEREGVHYHFITNDRAEAMIDTHAFVEAKYVHGTIYGTGAEQIAAIRDAGRTAVTDIDVQGVDEYKKLSSQVIAIFLLPPSYEEWRRRLRQRYASEQEFEAEWPKRRASAIAELERARAANYYHFVVNDNLQSAVAACWDIAIHRDSVAVHDKATQQLVGRLLDEIRDN